MFVWYCVYNVYYRTCTVSLDIVEKVSLSKLLTALTSILTANQPESPHCAKGTIMLKRYYFKALYAGYRQKINRVASRADVKYYRYAQCRLTGPY
jgi:hypothetical protein